ncbi:FadR/GntR family transcriptional regulator [Pseudarthrobacter oxydans]|uniref:FadR/GntR family transcriptional regulator n=1 Tax=Pseudarthrobacter oxydans TaxID=1671 RepID=UPI0037F841AC
MNETDRQATGLSSSVAAKMLADIVRQEHPWGRSLPSEAELAEAHGVSRLTVRESLAMLKAKRVVSIQPGTGSMVNPPTKWTDPHAISRAVMNAEGIEKARIYLEELKDILEKGLAVSPAGRGIYAQTQPEDRTGGADKARPFGQSSSEKDGKHYSEGLLTLPSTNVFLGPIVAFIHSLGLPLADAIDQIQENP